MSEPRIIKKYPNRRLYDTSISSYITLSDVKNLVLENVPVKVVEARTQEDITHNILLQIIIEQEETGPALFSTESLQKMIRFYGGSMQKMFSTIFEQGITLFDQSAFLNEDLPHATKTPPSLTAFAEAAQKNIQSWQQLQQQWVQSIMQAAPPKSSKNSPNE